MTDILKITAADIDADGFYIGQADVTDYPGHIEIAAGLGWVRFKARLSAKFSITAKAGTGIKAGLGIKAGAGIEAGWGIEAGSGIEAGEGIEAGDGIEAGFSISAKWVSSRLRIFAGLCLWRLPRPEEAQIHAELRSGTIAFGELVEPEKEAAA